MVWHEWLNKTSAMLPLGGGRVQLLYWAHSDALIDNAPHSHTMYEVCLVGEYGAGEFRVHGKPQAIGPRDLFIARPGVVHQIVNTQPRLMQLTWVAFQWLPPQSGDETDVDRLMRAFGDSHILVAQDDGRIEQLWQALAALASVQPQSGGDAQIVGVATALIIAIAQAGAPLEGNVPHLPVGPDIGEVTARVAVRYINDNLSRHITLPESAAHVSVSPRHLSRLFERYVGGSPSAYITRSRLDSAAGLLVRTTLPIKEVAAGVGLPDIHHFTRLFTRYYGCPPGEFRKRGEATYVLNRQNGGTLV